MKITHEALKQQPFACGVGGASFGTRGKGGGGVCRWVDGYDWEYYHRLGSAFDMGNRWIVDELKHIVNFETWGVLVHKPGWITELAVCVFL